jgi:hypothetical protein
MFDEDNGLAFPEEREVVLLAVEEDVPQGRDFEVLREHRDVGFEDGLVEFRELPTIVEELAENGVFDLPICHEEHPSLVPILIRTARMRKVNVRANPVKGMFSECKRKT